MSLFKKVAQDLPAYSALPLSLPVGLRQVCASSAPRPTPVAGQALPGSGPRLLRRQGCSRQALPPAVPISLSAESCDSRESPMKIPLTKGIFRWDRHEVSPKLSQIQVRAKGHWRLSWLAVEGSSPLSPFSAPGALLEAITRPWLEPDRHWS